MNKIPPTQHRLRIGRQSAAGRCYFVTSNCDPSGPGLQEEWSRELVQQAIHGMLGRGFQRLDAYVVMPTHMHLLFWLDETKSLSDALRDLKKYTSLRINRRYGRTGCFWVEAFHDHCIRTDQDYASHLDYILKNPVRDGLVREGEPYPYLGWGPWDADVEDSGRGQ